MIDTIDKTLNKVLSILSHIHILAHILAEKSYGIMCTASLLYSIFTIFRPPRWNLCISPAMMDCTPDHDLGCDFHKLAECRHRSTSRLASGALESYHQYGMESLDSSLKMQYLRWRRSQIRCLWSHTRRRRLCTKVTQGHLTWRQQPEVSL